MNWLSLISYLYSIFLNLKACDFVSLWMATDCIIQESFIGDMSSIIPHGLSFYSFLKQNGD